LRRRLPQLRDPLPEVLQRDAKVPNLFLGVLRVLLRAVRDDERDHADDCREQPADECHRTEVP
jgi:hypothetical protein